MSLIRHVVLRAWPKTLLWQLTLPLIVALFGLGLLIGLIIESLVQQRHDEVVQTAIQVSKSFQSLPRGVAGITKQNLESFLLSAARFPIQRIAIVNSNGNGVLAAVRQHSARAYLDEDASKIGTPPSARTPTLQASTDSVIYWLPENNPELGNHWLTVTATLQPINRWRAETLATAFGLYIVFSGAALLFMMLTARKSVKAIQESARFADTITSNPGSELPLTYASEELNGLAGALNRIGKHWRHRLQLSEQATSHLQMHKVAIDLHSAVCITNGAGRIEYVNKHFSSASGYEEKELLGRKIALLNSGYHDDHYFKTMWRTLALGRVWQGTLRNRNKRGELYWVHCTIAPIKDHIGRPCQYIAIQTPAVSLARQVDGVAVGT